MAGIPAEVRINTNTPFPTMVTGANGIGLGKNNGIWTVQLNINSLATATPPTTAFATDYVPVFDSNTGLYSKVSLSNVVVGAAPPVTTVALLPTPIAGLKGSMQFVTDATQTFTSANFGVTVTGGGANNVPVVCDGTNWKIG
jgi:hypothetical protein